jgi:hypothetical protein
VKRHTIYALVGGTLAVVGLVAWFAVLRPRATRIVVTTRAGDDTVVINQTHRTRLGASVLDQYGRRLRGETRLGYQRIGGDSVRLSSDGELSCAKHSDALVQAKFENLAKTFVLRCRPVQSIEAVSWLDLVVGDSARDLAFVAHGPDGRLVTELRGVISVNGSIVTAEGTTIRPMRSGETVAGVEVGDAHTHIPIVVYQLVNSFVGNEPRPRLPAVHVKVGRADTLEFPLPKAAFWVTYIPDNRDVPPPTIRLRGDGSCTTGNGVRLRRIVEGEYAKYCLTGDGARLMIAHGAAATDVISGVVAIRPMR